MAKSIILKTRQSAAIVWNSSRGWIGGLNRYYDYFGLLRDDYFGARTGQRDAKRNYKNEINYHKRKSDKYARRKSRIFKKEDKNHEFYMPEPERFLKSLSIEEKCNLADEKLKKTKEIGLKNGMSNSRLTAKNKSKKN